MAGAACVSGVGAFMSGIADTQANKRIALQFLEHCFKCNVDEVLAMLAPDATWWVLGDSEKIRVSGLRDGRRIERFLRKVRRGFPDGLKATIEGVTAEGERVAVEVTSSAQLAGGSTYSNRYHFLVRVRDGRVIEMREYLDTHYAYEVQLALEKASIQ